jgi:hypothetical protein
MHPKINQSINHTIKQQIIHGSHSLLFLEKILLTATEKKCEELGGVKQCSIL